MADGPEPLNASRLARELDWNLLRTFVVIAEANSITAAADRLRLKQPTVSAALARLETRLGKRLIERKPGTFRLTATGEALFREALEIHGAVSRIATAIRDIDDEVSGHVRLVMASHVVSPVLDDALRRFHEAHPRATLSIDIMRSHDALANVLARRASFAICLVHKRSARLAYRRLYREFFGLYCGPAHPLFGCDGLTLGDLAGQRSVSFVTDTMEDSLRAVAIMRAATGLDDRIVGTSAHLEEVRRMIVAGLGIGPLPVHVARPDVEAGRLWRLPPYEEPPAVDVHVAWHPKARTNRAEAACLAAVMGGIAATPIEERTYR